MPTLEIHKQLKDFLSDKFNELIIICPFISLNGIKTVFNAVQDLKNKNIVVVSRWRKLDIISGVSDLRVYPFLKKKQIKLFHHDRIHLKILLKDKKYCFFGSANLTETGLGIAKNANIELNDSCVINQKKYLDLKKIIKDSFLIDDQFYSQMLKLKKKNIKLFNKIHQIKKKFKQDQEWYIFLEPAFNREEFMKKWL